MKTEYTATEIAEALCKADGLDLADHTQIHNRLKYIAKRGILIASRKLDKRGTLAFAQREVYRAAIFCELIGLAMDVRALDAVMAAAASKVEFGTAPSQKTNHGHHSGGALIDAIRGVELGEQWFLKITRQTPGFVEGEKLVAEFYWIGFEFPDSVDDIFGRVPSRAGVTVDLTALFKRLIPLVGVPAK